MHCSPATTMAWILRVITQSLTCTKLHKVSGVEISHITERERPILSVASKHEQGKHDLIWHQTWPDGHQTSSPSPVSSQGSKWQRNIVSMSSEIGYFDWFRKVAAPWLGNSSFYYLSHCHFEYQEDDGDKVDKTYQVWQRNMLTFDLAVNCLFLKFETMLENG